ncbi:MAG TPA: vanadium-dependent haloperoxidase [Chitinophagales bacterium]|nr:vanadium-dependent haloperoxidase [Chitinophagales bacterium]HRX22718.1 vanadium-dependent haloperoxidase [Chitinophagales bacterium]
MKISLKQLSLATAVSAVMLTVGCAKEADFLQDQTGLDLEAKVSTSDFDATVPQAYMDHMLTMVKATPGWTPPVAARGFGYTGLALYESVVPGISGGNSMVGQLNELTSLPEIEADEKYQWEICANEALYGIISSLMPTASADNLAILASIHDDFDAGFASVPADIYERSVAFGQAIAEAIYDYSTTDGGHECYLYNFPADYVPPVGDGMWIPTPPGYSAALQPYWGDVRPFIAADVVEAIAVPPYAYSETAGSTMYNQALETFNYVADATDETTDIALFWADDPGATFTPPGHAWHIAMQVISDEDVSLAQAALTYGKLGVALNDAFITCFKIKYIYNLIRPISYIQEMWDPSFATIVGTPPFPEYTSGHSTNMGAWKKVMEDIYGKSYAFTDHTHEAVYGTRSFANFNEAAYEAAISRMYGGIHYKQACYQGVKMGEIVGENVNDLNWY